MSRSTKDTVKSYLSSIDDYVNECLENDDDPIGYHGELLAILANTIMELHKHNVQFRKR